MKIYKSILLRQLLKLRDYGKKIFTNMFFQKNGSDKKVTVQEGVEGW